MKIVKTICTMCRTRCGVTCYVENERIRQVVGMQEYPFNTLCVKGYAIPELVHSSERLTNPLRKIDGKFKEIPWDDAFGLIGDKLNDIKQRYGAKAVVAHTGNPYISTHMDKLAKRFCDLYGTPNWTTGGSLCFFSTVIAHSLTGVPNSFPNYSAATKCIVLWGNNPTETFPLNADMVHALKARGAKLIVIDPKATALAKKADVHAQIRPGTDCALALGLLNVIIAEGLYDKTFVEKWTVGFDKLVEHVREYTPERVEKITWVPAGLVRNMAHIYAANKPASIINGLSLQDSANGIQAIRAMVTLIGITGNLDIPGGNVYPSPGVKQTDLSLPEKVSKDTPIGADYPLFTKYSREQQMCQVLDQILTEKPYPIKGLILAGANSLVSWPNTNKVRKAFEKLEFLLVTDLFMTDTAKIADVVLPGTTSLEKQELRDYAIGAAPLITLTHKAIEPIGNTMEDWKIWAELGKRMGYAEYFPWKDTDELFEYLLKPSNISLKQLEQHPGGIFYAEREFQKYLKDGFDTPSKKLEIYSDTMDKLGYDPIPTFYEPVESPVSRPDLADKYPLILIGGAREIPFLNSQYRNLASLRKLVPEPLMDINPQAANSLGIADGDLVEVETLRGSIKIKAKVTEDIHPKIVSIPMCGTNVNYLTSDEHRDPVSGYPDYKTGLCRLSKAGG